MNAERALARGADVKPLTCSQVERSIFSLSFVFLKRLYDQFFLFVHDVEAFLYFFVCMNIRGRWYLVFFSCPFYQFETGIVS